MTDGDAGWPDFPEAAGPGGGGAHHRQGAPGTAVAEDGEHRQVLPGELPAPPE